ncbi:MAG: hypothetical protein IH624_07665 [Phycisphaerae bacterium]|nr:hypothetical protein [Phycisphaerae bacterium]
MSSVFEAAMLLCFGAAWPVSIYKSWKSRTTAGKSLVFLIIIELGYLSGIAYKLTGACDYVIAFYVLNAAMVLVDIALYGRNAAVLRGQENP